MNLSAKTDRMAETVRYAARVVGLFQAHQIRPAVERHRAIRCAKSRFERAGRNQK